MNAFLAAARHGDFDALLGLLDPDVVLRAYAGGGPLGRSRLIRGAPAVAEQVMQFARLERFAVPAMVNGSPGGGRARGAGHGVLGVTVRRGESPSSTSWPTATVCATWTAGERDDLRPLGRDRSSTWRPRLA